MGPTGSAPARTAPSPTPITPQRPRLTIDVSGLLECSNGVVIQISKAKVSFHKPGPNGGRGNEIEVSLVDWDQLAQAVATVRASVDKARQAVEE